MKKENYLEKLTYNNLENLANFYKYKWFYGNFNLNIIGIRSNSNNSKEFDDFLYVAFEEYYNKNEKDNKFYKKKQYLKFNCTLNPGKFYLNNLMDPGGAAIIFEGQHLGAWKLGSFYSTDALIQIKPIKIYRDKNKDDVIDLDSKNVTTGLYGIFVHEHFQTGDIAKEINKSSAGCIVLEKRSDFKVFIDTCKMQKSNSYGDTFSITIYNKEQVDKVLQNK